MDRSMSVTSGGTAPNPCSRGGSCSLGAGSAGIGIAKLIAAAMQPKGLSQDEARRRIAAQLPVEEKLRLATERIDCSGSLEETRRQVTALAVKLRRVQPPK